jgi:hypothetical protein
MRVIITAFTLFVLLPIAVVFAQTPVTPPVVVTPDPFAVFGAWSPYVRSLVDVVVYAVVAFAGVMISRWSGFKIEESHRQALQSALLNAAGLIVSKAGPSIMKDPNTGNQFLDEGLKYLKNSVPDALKYFGVTADTLETMLMAKIGVLAASNTPLVTPPST